MLIKRLNIIATFLLAALLMVYLSYMLPRLLPGDFVTAMYAGSDVTLSPEQEADLRSYFNTDLGFGEYLLRLIKLEPECSHCYGQCNKITWNAHGDTSRCP